jgi:hypothetical protein
MVNAMGSFRTVGGVQAVDSESAMTALLAEWKRDMPALTERFYTDHMGVLDQQEWEAARSAARQQVEERSLRETPAEYSVLCKPDDNRPFLLAAGNLEKLARRYRWQAVGALLVFVLLCGVLTSQFSG